MYYKKFSASSWLILVNKYIEMHGQQNIKIKSVLYVQRYNMARSRNPCYHRNATVPTIFIVLGALVVLNMIELFSFAV